MKADFTEAPTSAAARSISSASKVRADAVGAVRSDGGVAETPTGAQTGTYDTARATHVTLAAAEETEAAEVSRVVAIGARLVTGFERVTEEVSSGGAPCELPVDRDLGDSGSALSASAFAALV